MQRGARPRKKERPSLSNRGIGHVGLRVSSIKKSCEFYHEVLGLRTHVKGSRTAHIPLGPDVLVLFRDQDGSSDFHFGFRLESRSQVDKWSEWLKSNDIPLKQDISNKDHPRSIKFQDPDGHIIEIASSSKA